MNRRTAGPAPRRRTTSGLPVEGAIPPRGPRVVREAHSGTWLALTAVLLAVVAGTVAWRLQRSSYFVVQTVHVTGTSVLDPATIANLAAVNGRQLYELDPSASAAAIQRLPAVESAQVARVWPSQVDITVRERKPWGTWQIGGVNYLIDENGVVLDIVTAPWPVTIYELDAAPGRRPGDRVDGDAVRMARMLVDQLPHTIFQQVARLEYSSDGGLELLTSQNVRVRLGDSQGLDYKLAVWQALNAKLGANRVHLIDLRSVERPYYR
ncbi:MAG TPA: FtsQ-type POTRA domain-containing protein [Dehalococcoidia bacterium]|nr:FtsQ-type POTRA domain-containing protein [Dehalococcoidia bacterium]